MKLESVKKQVLDISRSNPLIHISLEKMRNAIVLSPVDKESFIDSLIKGKSYALSSCQTDSELGISFGEKELESKLSKIYERYKEIKNEQGINALYITIGLFQFHDFEKKQFNSPIVLIPLEMKRKRMRKGELEYSFSITDEKPILNVCLEQKLKEEGCSFSFQKLTDPLLLHSFMKELSTQAEEEGYQIDRTILLGIFYNPRMNMYFDLEENEERILNHPIIKAISGDLSGIAPLKEENPDSEFSYQKSVMVASADASQLQAIHEVVKGKSLIIQGPPGTGKSQTITNIIANALYKQKTVLFVAEKKAALEVVNRNLKRASLDDFCLYLDNGEINRKKLYQNLYQTLIQNTTRFKEENRKKIDKLEEEKNKLATYYQLLQEKLPNGNLSIYEAILQFAKYVDYESGDCFIEKVEEIDINQLEKRLQFIKNYNSYLDEFNVAYYKECIYYGFQKDTFQMEDRQVFMNLIKKVLSLEPTILQESVSQMSIKNLKSIYDFFGKPMQYFQASWLEENNVSTYCQHLEQYFQLKNKLEHTFLEELLEASIIYQLHAVPKTITVNSLKLYKKGMKENQKTFKKYLLNNKQKLTKEDVIQYTMDLQNFIALKTVLEKTDQFQTIDAKLLEEVKQVKELAENIPALKEEYHLWIHQINETKQEEKEMISQYVKLLTAFNAYYDVSIINLLDLSIPDVKKFLETTLQEIDHLPTYLNLKKEMSSMKDTEMIGWIDYLFANHFDRTQMESFYQHNYWLLWMDYIFSHYPMINDFLPMEHNKLRNEYFALDEEYQDISKALVREIASNKRPNPKYQSTKSDIGVLKIQKEKPTLYIKEMFASIKKLLQRMKPVMLMSPLSVSKYLPSDYEFDMVIFDEASQIKPEDAICAIYHAKQVVVVGDSKQLPPTDFFQKLSNLENEENIGDDFMFVGASLLDLCNTFLESIPLLWHYRSKNEELITFSNHYIYDDKLITFPSYKFNQQDEGIEYYQLDDATYSKGTTRVNQIEAQKIVELILEHIDHYPNRSLGVISFSLAQRNEIKNQLEKQLTKLKKEAYVNYERYTSFLYNEDGIEPFFIKNLENVQGDERDTIIFSIAYAKKEENGKLTQSLGRLTTEEGRKRINVATSRSKINMKVVCSFDPNELQITKPEQTGLLALKQFLLYAKTKHIQTYNQVVSNQQNPILLDIQNFLESKGYIVTTNIGNAKFKLDLGVASKEKPEEYLLGILLDGTYYQQCQFTRDREKLFEIILQQMGWKIMRCWSIDYIKSRNEFLNKIIKTLNGKETQQQRAKQYLETYEEEITNRQLNIPKKQPFTYQQLKNQLPSHLGYTEKFEALVSSIVEEGPIHLLTLSTILAPFFDLEKPSKNLLGIIEEKMNAASIQSKIKKEGFFYIRKNQTNFHFRKENNKQPIVCIYELELADLIQKIIEQSSGIYKDLLYVEVLRICGYKEEETHAFSKQDQTQFEKAFQYLLDKQKIEMINDLIYIK